MSLLELLDLGILESTTLTLIMTAEEHQLMFIIIAHREHIIGQRSVSYSTVTRSNETCFT